eukprot:Hpha_TRINITY_DN17022_c3_g2::TRINITY_DN17022_c3_g2_i1::g.166939::m.166939
MGAMRRCFGWKLLVRESDSPEDARMKQVMFPICTFIFVFAGAATFTSLRDSLLVNGIGSSICGLATVLFMVGALLNLASPPRLLDVVALLGAVGLCIMDAGLATTSNPFRTWTFIVLVLDFVLVFGRTHIPFFIIPFTLTYLAAVQFESVFRYGLYDVGYWGTGVESSNCNCASPPCAADVSGALLVFVAFCTVFLVDFYVTRGFANGMTIQLESVEASAAVSEEVAAALARYDVDSAEKAIAEGRNLPVRLKSSYLRLLSNLRSYRDYLPDSLLLDDEDNASPRGGAVAPPVGDGGPDVEVGIVFTDIQSSTALWETYPQGMAE